MKKLSLISLIITSLFTFSCIKVDPAKVAKEDSKQQEIDNLGNLPSWVLSPEVEGGVAAVGIASKTRGGLRFQIAKAEMDAKANIASSIQSEISRVTKEALRQARVNDVDDVEEVFSQATKDVVKNMPLSGATRINIYKDNEGTLYVHMILKNKDFSQYFRSSQRVYEDRLKAANMSRGNLDKAQDAVKELFDELEEERGK